jgi:hypothetical protein
VRSDSDESIASVTAHSAASILPVRTRAAQKVSWSASSIFISTAMHQFLAAHRIAKRSCLPHGTIPVECRFESRYRGPEQGSQDRPILRLGHSGLIIYAFDGPKHHTRNPRPVVPFTQVRGRRLLEPLLWKELLREPVNTRAQGMSLPGLRRQKFSRGSRRATAGGLDAVQVSPKID